MCAGLMHQRGYLCVVVLIVCVEGGGVPTRGGRVTKRGGTNFQSIHCLVNMDG